MDPVVRTLRVFYPARGARVVLRTEEDWGRDLEPVAVEQDGSCHVFHLRLTRPFLYLKPVLRRGDDLLWARGPNTLVLGALESLTRDLYPYFSAPVLCSEAQLHSLTDREGRAHEFRVFLPPGYDENALQRYPVVYMQDGHNLFFPQEAAFGETWRVAETIEHLTAMNHTAEMIVVGVQPGDRGVEYTKPGYEAYGRFLVEELKPTLDAQLRTRPEPAHTAVISSSLGGVASLYLAWQHPDVFGMAACLSSTFGYRDDLRERIADEPRRDIKIYLDSGFPSDNFEVTKQMVALLAERGYRYGQDLLYLAFPEDAHRESAWATRLHIPLQFLFGVARLLDRVTPAELVR